MLKGTNEDNKITYQWFEESYLHEGVNMTRRWPNEELCRFMGRNFFQIPMEMRRKVKILEAGCGTGANLKMLLSEGFDVYGIELSDEAVKMVNELYNDDRLHVVSGDMISCPYSDGMMDAVVDIFSSYCLTEQQYEAFSEELYRVLKEGGSFFSYTPSKGSVAWEKRNVENMLDDSTLNGMHDKKQPYYGNFYPFRFMEVADIKKYFKEDKWSINYTEKVIRTYNSMNTKFEFLTFEVKKI